MGTEVLFVVVLVALCVWGVRRIFSSIRRHERDLEALRAFAQSRGLVEETAPPPAQRWDADWKQVFRSFSRDPVVQQPPAGSKIFRGRDGAGRPLTVDTVLLRRWWTDSTRVYARMALDLPGRPSELDCLTPERRAALADSAGSGIRIADGRVFVVWRFEGTRIDEIERRYGALESLAALVES